MISKEQRQTMISEYINSGHSQEEVMGFINGIDTLIKSIPSDVVSVSKLHAVYNEDDTIISLHKTDEGAKLNADKCEQKYGGTFTVDYVVVYE